MADKEIKYYREFFSSKEGEIKTYDTLQEAIDDRAPRVKPQIFEMRVKLLGEVKWTLVPVGKETQAAVAVLHVGDPVTPPKKKK